MRITVLNPSDKSWSDLLNICAHDFYHIPGYVQLEAERMGGNARAYLLQESGYSFFIPLILRKAIVHGSLVRDYEGAMDAVSPYGYPTPLVSNPAGGKAAEEFLDSAITALIKKLEQDLIVSLFVRLHPLIPFAEKLEGLNRHGLLVHHGETVWIDLTLTPDELQSQIRSRYKTYINKLKRTGIAARIDETFARIDEFVKMYHQTMDSLSADEFYYFGYDYVRSLRSILGSSLSLCWVDDSANLLAGGLFSECCGIVQYHLSGTAPKSPFPDATKLMLTFVTGWAKARGNQKFHLGGGLGSQADSLFFFKSGFSKLRADFHTWRIISNREIYEAAMAQWKKSNNIHRIDEKGFFPPYRLINQSLVKAAGVCNV